MIKARFVLGFAVAGWLTASAAAAVQANPECVASARNNRKVCVLACQEEFQVEKDACRNINHECAEDCREIRKACFDVPLSTLRACVQAANDALEAAINDPETGCKALHPAGTPERDQCIDAAQVTAFQARDACREGLNREALKACRKAHRACLRLCPPSSTP